MDHLGFNVGVPIYLCLHLPSMRRSNTTNCESQFPFRSYEEHTLRSHNLYNIPNLYLTKVHAYCTVWRLRTNVLEIFQESCALLKDMGTKKETVELIEGFEQDIELFYEIHLKQAVYSSRPNILPA